MRIRNRFLARFGYYGHMSIDELLEFLKVWKLYWEVSELAEEAEGASQFLRMKCPDTDSDSPFLLEAIGPKMRELRGLRIFLNRPVSFASAYYDELCRLHQVWTDELDEVVPSFLRKRDEIALEILRTRFNEEVIHTTLLALRSEKLREYLKEDTPSQGLRKRMSTVLDAGNRASREERLAEVNECLLLAMTEIGLAEFHARNLSTLANEAVSVVMALETLIGAAPEFSVKGKSRDSVLRCLERQRESLQDFDPLEDSVADAFVRSLSAIGSILTCLS